MIILTNREMEHLIQCGETNFYRYNIEEIVTVKIFKHVSFLSFEVCFDNFFQRLRGGHSEI